VADFATTHRLLWSKGVLSTNQKSVYLTDVGMSLSQAADRARFNHHRNGRRPQHRRVASGLKRQRGSLNPASLALAAVQD
jgi:hypothetical protein